MSTKTLRKRIALVAVSAMGFGLLTSVSANATASALYLGANSSTSATVSGTKASNTSTGVLSGSGDISSTSDTAAVVSTGTLGLFFSAGTGNSVATVSGGTITTTSDDGGTTGCDSLNTARTIVGDASYCSFQVTPNAGATSITIKLYDDASGTTSSSGGTLITTLLVSVGTTASIGVFSASDSFAKVHTGAASGAVSSNADTDGAATIANGGEGIIQFSLYDKNGTALTSASVVTVSATNGAIVSLTTGDELGSTASGAYGGTYGNAFVAQADANKGYDTVVTISVDGVPFVSRAFTLLGAVSKITLAAPYVGALSGNGSFYMTVNDDAGHQLGSVTPTADASLYNSSVTSVTPAASSATAATAQAFACSAIAGAGSVQYSIVNAAAVKIVSNKLDVACAGNPYTWTATLDKSTYKPGEIATLTITAKDAKGNLTNATATLGTATTYEVAVAGAQLTAVTAPTNADTFTSVAGAKTYKFIVGTTEGSYSLSVQMPKWSGGANSSSATQTAQTVAYTVNAGSTAVTNAEVLAAIVKLIASINKQIAALQKALTKKK